MGDKTIEEVDATAKVMKERVKEGAFLGEEKSLEFVLTKVQKRKSVRLLDISLERKIHQRDSINNK